MMSTKVLSTTRNYITPEDPVFITLDTLEQNNPLAYHPNYLHPTTPLFSTSNSIAPIDPAHPPNYLHPTHPILSCAEEVREKKQTGGDLIHSYEVSVGKCCTCIARRIGQI
jgi:hypothetical protein